MIAKKIKNIKFINNFKKNELKLKINKFLFSFLLNLFQLNKNFKEIFLLNKINSYFQLNKFKISKVKIFRNCILTNRSRAVYRPYGISRCALKNLIQFGRLPGTSKAIW